jgi:serine/threonine-protein kinase
MPTTPLQLGAVVIDASAGDPLLGREVGGYVIEAPLSEGGMGLVYRARHPFLGRAFAVKVLRPEYAADDALSGNFVREAQTLSGLKHPHIIDIVGFGSLDGRRQYMVMEFLEGRSLEAELQERGALGVARALELAEPVLSALEAAHSVDVIHRDLKPGNVFLSRVSGGGEVVKLLDFGLAKLQPQALAGLASAGAGQSVIAGTPEYISPEQALGKPASRASDLYSFGVLLFEMLTGRQPFDALDGEDRVMQLLRQHVHEPAPGLAAASGEPIPAELEQLVEELLRKDPAERPTSAGAVRQRLRRIQRETAQATTRQVANPLLEVSEAPPSRTTTGEAAGPLQPEELAAVRAPRRLPTWLPVALGLLLVGAIAASWPRTGAASETPPEGREAPPGAGPPATAGAGEHAPLAAPGADAPAPGGPPAPPNTAPALADGHPVATAPSAPRPEGPMTGGRGTPPAPDDELTPLSPTARPAPARRVTPTFQVTHFECEPDEAWRAAARSHLQELQQLAAARGRAAFGRFEALEPRLTKDIEAARDGQQCDAVDRRIRQLARELSP